MMTAMLRGELQTCVQMTWSDDVIIDVALTSISCDWAFGQRCQQVFAA